MYGAVLGYMVKQLSGPLVYKSCIWIILTVLSGKAIQIQGMEPVANDSLPDSHPSPSLSLVQVLLEGSTLDGQRLEAFSSILDMKLSTDGRNLYVIDYFDQVLIVLSVSHGGILGYPRQYRIDSIPGVKELGNLALDPDGHWLSVGGNGIIRFEVLDDGSLCCPRVYPSSYYINAITPDPSGRFLYAYTSISHVIVVYQIQDDGSLADPDICLTGVGFYCVGVFHPNNRFFYLLEYQRLSVYKIMPNGQLTFIQEVSDYGSPDGISLPLQLSHMVVDSLGTTLYVADEHASKLFIFSVSEDGRLLKSSAVNYPQFINGFGWPTGGPHFLALTRNDARLFLTSWETIYSWLRFLDFGESGNITHQEYYGNDLSSQSCTNYCFSPGPRFPEDYHRRYTYQWVHSLAISHDGLNIFASSSDDGGLLAYRVTSIAGSGKREAQALCDNRLAGTREHLQKTQLRLSNAGQQSAYFHNLRKNKQQQINDTEIQIQQFLSYVNETRQQKLAELESGYQQLSVINQRSEQRYRQIIWLETEAGKLQAELENLENQLARTDSSAAGLSPWLWPIVVLVARYL